MVGQGVCCSICDSGNKAALVCPACINNTLLYERRKLLLELSERRAALLQKLNDVIAQRQPHVELEVRRQRVAAEAAEAAERGARAQQAVELAKRSAAALRASLASRRAAHERCVAELAARRAEHLAHHPTMLRYQALTHSHISAMLLAEQRAKLGVLLDCLPLRVAAIRQQPQQVQAAQQAQQQQQQQQAGLGPGSIGPGLAQAGQQQGSGGSASGGATAGSGGSGPVAAAAAAAAAVAAGNAAGAAPIQVTLCNLKLPDAASVCALMLQQPEHTSSALGYLLLLADLLATYLGGPLLHEGAFQASTSVAWAPSSFWNRRPPSSAARLPLFLEEGGGGAGGGGGVPGIANPFPGLAAKVRGPSVWASPGPGAPSHPHAGGGPAPAAASSSSSGSGAFAALTRAMSSATGVGGGGASGGGGGAASYDRQLDEALARQRHTELRLAYDMLARSLACFVRDKAQPLGLALPPGWGPFGWLAVLCASVWREPGTEAVLAAAAAAAAASGGQGGGDPRVGGGECGDYGGGGADHDDDEPAEVEEDGWDVVQAPFLPPPPSQPDEVEHWTRAMFTDASGGGAGGSGGAAAGGIGSGSGGRKIGGGLGMGSAASMPPAMSLERVRSLFGK